jgi:hypothetical protein
VTSGVLCGVRCFPCLYGFAPCACLLSAVVAPRAFVRSSMILKYTSY